MVKADALCFEIPDAPEVDCVLAAVGVEVAHRATDLACSAPYPALCAALSVLSPPHRPSSDTRKTLTSATQTMLPGCSQRLLGTQQSPCGADTVLGALSGNCCSITDGGVDDNRRTLSRIRRCSILVRMDQIASSKR